MDANRHELLQTFRHRHPELCEGSTRGMLRTFFPWVLRTAQDDGNEGIRVIRLQSVPFVVKNREVVP